MRRVALIPGNSASDPTFRAVRRGLTRALPALGWRVAPPGSVRADAAHLHAGGAVSAAALEAFRRLRAAGARGVLTLQDLDHPDLRPDPAARRRLAALLKEADAVTALEPRLARRAGRRGVVVIGNGVGPEWTPAGRRDAPLVVTASRLAPYKGVDILIWAFEALSRRHPEARLMVFGRDFQSGHHRRLARLLGVAGRVRFAGDAPPARLRAAFRRARVFVFPSRRETGGMALLEALACGAPCLATRTGAGAGLRHGREALVVGPGRVQALSRGLLRLWEDPALRRRLSAGGRAAARRRRWSAAAAAYAKVYRA